MKCEEAKRIMREEETFCNTHLVLSVFLFFVCVSMSKAVDYSPISYWSFDEGRGTTVYDYKETNHGRIENETAVTWVEGHVGEHALSFTGTGGYVHCSKHPSLDITGPKTVALWIYKRPENQPRARFIYQGLRTYERQSSTIGAYVLGLGEKGDGKDLEVQFGSAMWMGDLDTPIQDNTWTHVLASHDEGGVLRIYINGVLQSQTSRGTACAGNTDFIIGAGLDGAGSFNGRIDEVRVWDYKLQGKWFHHPRFEMTLEHPERVKKTTPDWYRGKALAIRIPWNKFLQGKGYTKPDAGVNFNAEEWVDIVESSGACGVMLKMRASTGFVLYPSLYNTRNFESSIDYPALLGEELESRGLKLGVNLSKANIDAMAETNNVSVAQSYYDLVDEILTRYPQDIYQFRFDSFWPPDPAQYDHQSVFENIRAKHPETIINFNRYTGEGAEDMGPTEVSRPMEQVHYWEQEDFASFIPFRSQPWAHECETPMGDSWSGIGGDVVSLPVKNLLNLLSTMCAMGLNTVFSMGPDVTGKFDPIQIDTLAAIGQWLIPRKPFLDNAIPNLDITVTGYSGLWYVNTVGKQIVVHLLTGSRDTASLPHSVDIHISDSVTSVHLAPDLTEIPFTKETHKIILDLTAINQSAYSTIIVLSN